MTGFYFDEHMNRLVADALIKKGYHVVMAVDVSMKGKDDDTEHLPYASEHDLVMVTSDHPFAGRTMARSITQDSSFLPTASVKISAGWLKSWPNLQRYMMLKKIAVRYSG